VDGALCRDAGAIVQPETSSVALDGAVLLYSRFHYFMVHKPAGVLTACDDAREQTIMDLLPPDWRKRRIMPVGRLDRDVTGLLLFTNDGPLAHALIHPKNGVEKVYRAELTRPVLPEDIEAFAAGLDLGDFTALPALLRPASGNSALITVCEGKYHQVKRMCEAIGNPVIRLHREAFGPLVLPTGLQPGEWRELRADEVEALRAAVES